MLYPLTFEPILKERIWGGRKLETLYHKSLPPDLRIGESWEISDRPGDVSVINRGRLAGKDLRWLVQHHREALLGSGRLVNNRFPLLLKILDASETLSLQVHPPASAALRLKGEPKTEMWFIAEAGAGAELFAGLRRGVTKQDFENKLKSGRVADCFHRLKAQRGGAMFVPSGRMHALGAGCVVFEVQQNSDTTYRVFDWNRLGPDGKPRELHIEQSLQSIDFDDFEPGLVDRRALRGSGAEAWSLVQDDLFDVDLERLASGQTIELAGDCARIIAVVGGQLHVPDQTQPAILNAGQVCLLPACLPAPKVTASGGAEFLVVRVK